MRTTRATVRALRSVAICLAAVVAATTQVSAQGGTGVVQGTVSGESGLPLEGATVVIVGTRLGAVSRPDGRYIIAAVPAGPHLLRATRIGYALRERRITVTAGQTATENFDMPNAAVALDQVVVVGYGTQSQRDLTGSVTSVSDNEIATIPVARIDQAITGLVSGVQIQSTNTQPGAEIRIRVRGGNSLNGSNEPLVVVDGVIGADFNQINPNEIESINVLKDASAGIQRRHSRHDETWATGPDPLLVLRLHRHAERYEENGSAHGRRIRPVVHAEPES